MKLIQIAETRGMERFDLGNHMRLAVRIFIVAWLALAGSTALASLDFMVYQDESFAKNPEEILSADWQQGRPNEAYLAHEGILWLKVTIPAREVSEESYLVLDHPLLRQVELYANLNEPPLAVSGIGIAATEKAGPFAEVVFALEPKNSNSYTLYLKVESDFHVPVDLQIIAKNDYILAKKDSQRWLLFCLGWMLSIFIYNGFLYLFTRNKAYLYYSGLIGVAHILTVLGNSGLIYEILWTNLPTIAVRQLAITSALTVALNNQFAIILLSINRKFPKISFFLRTIAIIEVIHAGIAVFYSHSFTNDLSIALLLVSLATIFGAVTKMIVKREKYAIAFILASSPALIGALVFFGMTSGIFPVNPFTKYALPMGMSLEAVLFAVALAHRIRFVESSLQALKPDIMTNLYKEQLDPNRGESIPFKRTTETCSMMFVDIVGFSKVLANANATKDEDTVVDLLIEFQKELKKVISASDGIIDRTLGDGILCFFMDRSKDSATSAFECAVNLQTFAHSFSAKIYELHGFVFPLRIGIASGRAHILDLGTNGRLDLTCLSDDVNFAKRIESGCDPYRILICPETYKRVKNSVTNMFHTKYIPVKGQSSLAKTHQVIFSEERESAITKLDRGFRAYHSKTREYPRLSNSMPRIYKSPYGKLELVNFSLGGLGLISDVCFAKGVILEIESAEENPDAPLLATLILEVMWSRPIIQHHESISGYQVGTRVVATERAKEQIYEKLRLCATEKPASEIA